jgi:hypothetical protein
MHKLISSIALLIASAALLIFALKYSPAKAGNDISNNSSGKIMMDQNSFVYNNQYYYNILVWDTETGRSKLYYTNTKEWVLDTQLPASPLY